MVNHKKRLNKSMLERNIIGWAMLVPTVFLAFFIIWRPVFVGFYQSMFKMQGAKLVEFVGFNNYMIVLKDTNFLKTLGNTFKYVGLSLIIGFPPPLIIAILLNESRHLKSFFKASTYLPVVLPAIAVYMLWTQMYLPGKGGLLNQLLSLFGADPYTWLQDSKNTILWIGITMTWRGMGGTILMYLAALQGVNRELYEAAIMDGAGLRVRIRHIMMPEILPIALLMLVRQIIGVFQVMEEPLTMTGGGPNGASTSLALLGYNYAFKFFQFDRAQAVGGITFVILICVTFMYLKLEKKLNED